MALVRSLLSAGRLRACTRPHAFGSLSASRRLRLWRRSRVVRFNAEQSAPGAPRRSPSANCAQGPPSVSSSSEESEGPRCLAPAEPGTTAEVESPAPADLYAAAAAADRGPRPTEPEAPLQPAQHPRAGPAAERTAHFAAEPGAEDASDAVRLALPAASRAAAAAGGDDCRRPSAEAVDAAVATVAQAALQPPPSVSAELAADQPIAPSTRVHGSMLPADLPLQTSPAASPKGAAARTTSATLDEEGSPEPATQRPIVPAVEARDPGASLLPPGAAAVKQPGVPATQPSDASAAEGAGAAAAQLQVAGLGFRVLPSADGAASSAAGDTARVEGLGSGTYLLQPQREPQSPEPPRNAASPVSAPPAEAQCPPSRSAIDHACAALLGSSGCSAADAAAFAAGQLAAAAPEDPAAASTATAQTGGAKCD